MSYQVLARKWRPQRFIDVVGQEHVLAALANGLAMGRLHHAYLLSGTRGVGKTSIARLLAKGLNCETGITAAPCGQCINCKEIEQGRFVDLIEIDAASRTKVEDTRELLDNVQYLPARGRFKVYLIDEVHMLSRHSFNALLKTLEEPPEHVKFLLATTDPQKLPVTILSRCLQFHLQALDAELIRTQLLKVLQAEKIESEPRALYLLAKAASGSLRDALSLTDQAIAMGQGFVGTNTVSKMLGLLDTEQSLALLEALVATNAAALMAQIESAAGRGIEWEMLLSEVLSLLHRIAIMQLLPTLSANEEPASQQRLRELAKTLPPQDLQLYYQLVLNGRKDLPYAPDRRMGVEMTFLRALAFQPKAEVGDAVTSTRSVKGKIALEKNSPEQAIPGKNIPENMMSEIVSSAQISEREKSPQLSQDKSLIVEKNTVKEQVNSDRFVIAADSPSPENQPAASELVIHQPSALKIKNEQQSTVPLTGVTEQLLQARKQLRQQNTQEISPAKKLQTPANASQPGREAIARIKASADERKKIPSKNRPEADSAPKKEAYRWQSQQVASPETKSVITPNALRMALEYEKTPELLAKLVQEAVVRDNWAAQIEHLQIPRLVQQLALNAFKEQVTEDHLRLHLRSGQRHLNTEGAKKALSAAISQQAGRELKLEIIEDDDLQNLTPLEWRQAIYEEKLAQARQSITTDKHIQALCRLFDAAVDQDSIRPV